MDEESEGHVPARTRDAPALAVLNDGGDIDEVGSDDRDDVRYLAAG
jgi:hypothetical protein